MENNVSFRIRTVNKKTLLFELLLYKLVFDFFSIWVSPYLCFKQHRVILTGQEV